MLWFVLYLEGVLCRSVGVLLAEAHAVGAGALSRDLAGEEVATLTTVVVHGCQNGGDLTWLLVHGPERQYRFKYLKNVSYIHMNVTASFAELHQQHNRWQIYTCAI